MTGERKQRAQAGADPPDGERSAPGRGLPVERRCAECDAVARRLTELGHQLAGSVDVAQAADLIASAVLRLTGVRRVVLERIDPASGALVCMAAAGDVPPDLVGTARPADEGVAGLAVRGAMPVWSRVPAQDRRLRTSEASRRVEGERSVVAAPLLAAGKVTGTVVVGVTGSRRLPDTELWRFLAVADQAALALENVRLHEALDARAGRLAALTRVAQTISGSLDTCQVLDTIVGAACDLMRAAFAGVWVASEDGRRLAFRGASDPRAGSVLDGEVLAPGEGLVGWVAVHRRILEVPDVFADGRAVNLAWWREAGLRSFVGAPIIADGALAGVLALCAEAPLRLEPDDRALLESFAAHSAIAIRNARLYEEATRRGREAEVMAGLLREMAESLDLETVLSRVAEAARALCGADAARVALRETSADGVVLRNRYWVGARTGAYEGLRIRPGEGAGGLVLQSGRPFRTDDYLADPRITRTFDAVALAEGHVSELVVPIRTGDRIDGLLYVNRRQRRPFTDRDEAVLLRLADHASVAIGNAQAFERASRATAEAEAARRRWYDLVQSLDAVVWEAAPPARDDAPGHRRCSFVSERVEALLGHPVERWLEDPGFWLSLVHPEDREGAEREWARAVGEGGDLALEYRLCAAGGREVWVHETARAVRGGDGTVTGWRGVMTDVTAERSAVRALRESDERFRRAFEDGPVGMALLDLQGRWVLVNRALCSMTGYGDRDLIGLGLDGLVHPEDLAAERAERLRLLAGGSERSQRVVRFIHRAGHVIWVEVTAAPWHDAAGTLRGGIMQVRDVTAEKWASRRVATLLAIEEALAGAPAVAEAIPRLLDAVCRGVGWELGEWWRIDRDAGVLRWDTMVCVQDLGLEEFERVSRAIVLAPGQGLPGRAWASGRPEWVENTAADARFLRTALVTSAGLHAAVACPVRVEGDVIGVMVFFARDVYRPDPDLLALMGDIDRRVAALAARRASEGADRREGERRAADRATEAARALVRSAAATLDHAVSSAAAQADALAATAPEVQHPALEALRGAINAVGETASGLAAFAGAQAFEPRAVDLDGYLRASRERLGRRCGPDVTLELLLDEGLPPVWADPEGLGALVDFLVENGLAAMPSGGHLVLETGREADPEAEWVVLAVHDTGTPVGGGPGPRPVGPEDLGSLSLPLAAAWGLARQHGGRITIEGDPHGGNTVRAFLPPAVEVLRGDRERGSGPDPND